MGHNNSIDLSDGGFLYSIGKVQLSIGLLHIISETKQNIAVVEGPQTFVDSVDLSKGEFLYSIGKVQLSIGLLHLIS